nr:hypothetical protein [Corynebacterium lipophiloflavum]
MLAPALSTMTSTTDSVSPVHAGERHPLHPLVAGDLGRLRQEELDGGAEPVRVAAHEIEGVADLLSALVHGQPACHAVEASVVADRE